MLFLSISQTLSAMEVEMSNDSSCHEKRNNAFAPELGKTGKKIKPIGFGAGQLSIGEHTEERKALAILQEAMNVYDMIDTADS